MEEADSKAETKSGQHKSGGPCSARSQAGCALEGLEWERAQQPTLRQFAIKTLAVGLHYSSSSEICVRVLINWREELRSK